MDDRPSPTAASLTSTVDDFMLSHPKHGYLRYHAPRYRFLLERLEARMADKGELEPKILDVGASIFTEILHASTGLMIDTMGFRPEGKTEHGTNFHFNLNDCAAPDFQSKAYPTYDVIFFCEVIEHLYTSPLTVLAFLRTLLNPGGCIIIQTPNAVAINKRLRMLAGQNPYEEIRTDLTDPGHFREYTKKELYRYAEKTGFRVVYFSFQSYFDTRFYPAGTDFFEFKAWKKLILLLYKIAPPVFRQGITTMIESTD